MEHVFSLDKRDKPRTLSDFTKRHFGNETHLIGCLQPCIYNTFHIRSRHLLLYLNIFSRSDMMTI